MRVPKFIAAFVCLLLAFTLFQDWMWPSRPEPGWHPSWWQSHTWADFGSLLSMPAFMLDLFPTMIFQTLGVTNAVAKWLVIAFGYLLKLD
jgi:hypothetical protein